MNQATRLGEDLNAVAPGAFDGLRRAGDGFAVSIDEDENWAEHRRKVREYINVVRDVILAGTATGFQVVIDTAIGPEDYAGRLLTSFPLDSALLKACTDLGVEIEFSLYGTADEDDQDP